MRGGSAIAVVRLLLIGGGAVFVACGGDASTKAGTGTKASQEPAAQFRAEREALIDRFRIGGTFDPAAADELAQRIRAYVPKASGEPRARALFELATVERLGNHFVEAAKDYEAAIMAAESAGLRDLAFSAALGIARCHANGTHDHGAAVAAYDRAIGFAAGTPTRKQRYELADYAAQFAEGRGDLDSALVYALDAVGQAEGDEELAYAEGDVGSVLERFAASCDYRKLIDAKSASDGGDGWDACRRAVASARTHYRAARDAAARRGFKALAHRYDEQAGAVGQRLDLIELKAREDALLKGAAAFSARSVEDVLVNEEFDTTKPDAQLASMVATSGVLTGGTDALSSRQLYLRGLMAVAEGRSGEALDYYKQSVAATQREMASVFEVRQRGTIVESRIEHVRDLGLRLTAVGELEQGFQAFESIRAQGLTVLSQVFEKQAFSAEQRRWLADLISLESRESSGLRGLVETAIAGTTHSRTAELRAQIEQARGDRARLLAQPEFASLVGQLAAQRPGTTPLAELQRLSKASKVPVLLYWATPTNVVVWLVTPKLLSVKAVLLPEPALRDKVTRLRRSLATPGSTFDRDTAQQLYAYLFAPFRKHVQGQLLIVPQGPLMDLPFEVLQDAGSGRYLIEDIAIGYAPNAHLAARTLAATRRPLTALRAVYDPSAESLAGEVSRLENIGGIRTDARPTNELSADQTIDALGGASDLHVLLHGTFEPREPLLSTLSLGNQAEPPERSALTAAELVAVDWRATDMAVMSACEGGVLGLRISNELYGFAWPLLAGGVRRVVLSRFRVDAGSSADWSEAFYRALAAKGVSAAEAAAAGTRALMHSAQYSHPFYWSAPQLFGL